MMTTWKTFVVFLFLLSAQFELSAQSADMKRFVFAKKDTVYNEQGMNGTDRIDLYDVDIDRVDSILRIFARKEGYFYLRNTRNYDEYYRQYFGFEKNHERVVLVNAFCQPHEKSKRQLIEVAGGGSCYFQAWINLSDKECYSFCVNAPR